VTPDDPVLTSIDDVPVNVRVLPLEKVWPAAPTPGSILPSTQTLIQARPPLAVTTRVSIQIRIGAWSLVAGGAMVSADVAAEAHDLDAGLRGDARVLYCHPCVS